MNPLHIMSVIPTSAVNKVSIIMKYISINFLWFRAYQVEADNMCGYIDRILTVVIERKRDINIERIDPYYRTLYFV